MHFYYVYYAPKTQIENISSCRLEHPSLQALPAFIHSILTTIVGRKRAVLLASPVTLLIIKQSSTSSTEICKILYFLIIYKH